MFCQWCGKKRMPGERNCSNCNAPFGPMTSSGVSSDLLNEVKKHNETDENKSENQESEEKALVSGVYTRYKILKVLFIITTVILMGIIVLVSTEVSQLMKKANESYGNIIEEGEEEPESFDKGGDEEDTDLIETTRLFVKESIQTVTNNETSFEKDAEHIESTNEMPNKRDVLESIPKTETSVIAVQVSESTTSIKVETSVDEAFQLGPDSIDESDYENVYEEALTESGFGTTEQAVSN